jgi:branched-chain amino acid transport system permease protein
MDAGPKRETSPAGIAFGWAIVLLLLSLPLTVGEFGTFVLSTGAIYVIAALGLHILTHWAGQVSLGHIAFVAFGSFMTANLAQGRGLPFWLALVLAALVSVAASVVIGLPALRIRGPYLAIVTLALGFAADRWLLRQQWLSGGSSGISIPKPRLPGIVLGSSRSVYYIVIIATILMVLLARKIGRTKAGRALIAINADEDVAASWGINVAMYKLIAFAIAGGFAAVAGGLQAYTLGIVGPQTFPVTLSIQFVAIVVIGGAGPIWGTVFAAALFGMLPSLESGLARYSTVIGALGILAIITRYPGGLNEIGRRIGVLVRRGARRGDTHASHPAPGDASPPSPPEEKAWEGEEVGRVGSGRSR